MDDAATLAAAADDEDPVHRYEYDFEDPRVDVNGIVVDYISYRLKKEGIDWTEAPELACGMQVEHGAVRECATIFERRHAVELNELLRELLVNDHVDYNGYCEVIEKLCRSEDCPMSMTYGRLSGILAFTGVTAVAMANEGRSMRDIAVLTPYTARFIEQKIRQSWPSEKRSWADFVITANRVQRIDQQRLKEQQRRNSRRYTIWGIAVAGVFGLGALTLKQVVFSK